MDKLVIEWSNQKTLLFIDLYKSKPVLWDVKHPEYYNRQIKSDAWQEISDAVQLPSEECKRKITTLLASLRREKRKLRMNNGWGPDGKESGWFFYKSLSFLRDRDKSRRSNRGGSSVKAENTADQPTDSPNGEVEIDDIEVEDEILSTNHDFGTLWDIQEVDKTCDTQTTDFIPTPQKRKRHYSDDIPLNESRNKTSDLPQISEALQELRRITNSVKEEDNEFNIFGKFVAANLNKLPLIHALKLQEKINSLITAERISCVTSSKS